MFLRFQHVPRDVGKQEGNPIFLKMPRKMLSYPHKMLWVQERAKRRKVLHHVAPECLGSNFNAHTHRPTHSYYTQETHTESIARTAVRMHTNERKPWVKLGGQLSCFWHCVIFGPQPNGSHRTRAKWGVRTYTHTQ